MRKYLSIAALLAAGAAFANAASVTYGEAGTENTVSAGDQNIYTLSGENPYKSVKISSAEGDTTVNVLIGTWDGEEGTVDGMSVMSVNSSPIHPVNITLRNGTLSGEIDTSGSTGVVNIDLQMGSSTESLTTRIAAGTSFVLSSNTTLQFNDMSSGTGVLVWNLSADDVANQNVLISGKGTVTFSKNVTIVLNFESEAALTFRRRRGGDRAEQRFVDGSGCWRGNRKHFERERRRRCHRRSRAFGVRFARGLGRVGARRFASPPHEKSLKLRA